MRYASLRTLSPERNSIAPAYSYFSTTLGQETHSLSFCLLLSKVILFWRSIMTPSCGTEGQLKRSHSRTSPQYEPSQSFLCRSFTLKKAVEAWYRHFGRHFCHDCRFFVCQCAGKYFGLFLQKISREPEMRHQRSRSTAAQIEAFSKTSQMAKMAAATMLCCRAGRSGNTVSNGTTGELALFGSIRFYTRVPSFGR